MATTKLPRLDPREEHFRIPSHHDRLSLFLRYLPPERSVLPSGDLRLLAVAGEAPLRRRAIRGAAFLFAAL